MTGTVLADIFLVIAVALVLASVIGLLVMRDTYQKLHYITPLAVLAPLAVGLAVLSRSGWSVNSALIWLAVLFLVIAGPFLSHATIRAARIRETGGWLPGPGPGHGRDAGPGPGEES